MNNFKDTKDIYAEVYKTEGHDYGSYQDKLYSDQRSSALLKTITDYMQKYSLNENSSVLEIGCGLGHLNHCHPNWKGLEYSSTAAILAKNLYGDDLNISEGDARELPFTSNSVDFLYSFAALEHIPKVEKAFSEIERVLKPGGVAILSPAWNCRPWTVKKLQQRPYSELKFSEKVGKSLIPLRNNLIFRMLCAFPLRLRREASLLLNLRPCDLQYNKLEPDFSLWNKYKHISDDDAFINIDAHAAIMYFISRKWRCESHPKFINRFGCRGEEIVVKKTS